MCFTHKGQMPEKELIERAAGEGVRVYGMSDAGDRGK